MKTVKRILGLLLAVVILLGSVTIVGSATQSKTENFNKNYSYSSNPVDYILNVAQAQVGLTGAQMGYTEAWCADFIGDCAKLANQSSAIPLYGGCDGLITRVINAGGKKVTNRQKGDLVFYYCSACGCYVHVGLVLDETYSIEGNLDGLVKKFNSNYYYYNDSNGHSTSNGIISKVYVRPNYSKAGTNGIEYRNISCQNISTKDANIISWISNPTGKTIWSTGFWFGTDPNKLSLYVAYTRINWTDFCCDYQLSKYCGELSPGTKYYYRFYVVEEENFNYSESDLYSFTTYGTANIYYDSINVTTANGVDANINAWCRNKNGYTISSCGFYFGESPTTMIKYQIYSNIAWTDFHIQTNVAKYVGTLIPGKTYYYRFYSVIDTNYYSDIYSFTTDSTVPTMIVSFESFSESIIQNKIVTYDSVYGALPTPTRTGYRFDGWYTSANGGTRITSSTKVTATSDHTLYAHWSCNHTSTSLKNAIAATCTAKGYTGDTYCLDCGVVTAKGTEIPAMGHSDNNNDGKCDTCGVMLREPEKPDTPDIPTSNCSHLCHKGGISKLFYKIALFFWKMFRTNKNCSCGAAHY